MIIQVCKKCSGGWAGTVGLSCPFCQVKVAEIKIERLEKEISDCYNLMDSMRDEARNRNPDGRTIPDFMAVWNNWDYERRIKEQKTEIEQLKKAIVNYKTIVRYDMDRIKEFNTEIERLEEVIVNYETTTSYDEDRIQKQKTEMKKLEAKIKELEKTNVALLGQLDNRGSVTLEFQNVTGHQVACIQEIKIKELMTEIKRLREVVQRGKADAKAFRGEGHTSWCRSNSTMGGECNCPMAIHSKLEELKRTNTRMDIKIVELEHHHRYMELQRQLKVEEIKQLKGSNNALATKIIGLRTNEGNRELKKCLKQWGKEAKCWYNDIEELNSEIKKLREAVQSGETLRIWYKGICDKLCISLNVRTPTVLPSAVRSLKERTMYYKNFAFSKMYGGE